MYHLGAQGLCESRGGRPGIPAPNSPCGLCGREATIEQRITIGWPLLAGEGGMEAGAAILQQGLETGLIYLSVLHNGPASQNTEQEMMGVGGLSGSEMGC